MPFEIVTHSLDRGALADECGGPAFTLSQQIAIESWAAPMRRRGLRTAIAWQSAGQCETLLITSRWASAPRWRIWRIGGDGVTVAQAGATPRRAGTIGQALAAIALVVEADDAVTPPGAAKR